MRSITQMVLWKLKMATQLIRFQRVWFKWGMKSLGLIYSFDSETIRETSFMEIYLLTPGTVIMYMLTNFLIRYLRKSWSPNHWWRTTLQSQIKWILWMSVELSILPKNLLRSHLKKRSSVNKNYFASSKTQLTKLFRKKY